MRWRHARSALMPLLLMPLLLMPLLLLLDPAAAAAGPGAAELRSPAIEERGARLDRTEELRRQLRDHHQRWRKGSAAPHRMAAPLPAHTPSLTPATLPRYRQISADGAKQPAAGGKVQEPPKPDSRLSDAERALLHRQLRQVAREQALPRDR